MALIVARTALIAGTLAALAAAPAHAGDVSWSVGIHAPIGPGVAVGTVISGGGYGAPVYAPVVLPPPVVVPAPVYAPPVVYAPPMVYPAPVFYPAPVWVGGRWGHRHHKHYDSHGSRGRYDAGWQGGYRGSYPTARRPGREIRY